jgi:hypothetical protein
MKIKLKHLALVTLVFTPATQAQYVAVAPDFQIANGHLPVTPQFGFSVSNGQLYSWNWGNTCSITDLSNMSLVFQFAPYTLDGNGYGDPFGIYDPENNVFYVGTFNGAGSGMWRYSPANNTWTKLGVFNSLYGADIYQGRVYASGLNQIWNGKSGQDNQIALYDLSGQGHHDVLIQTTGNSATTAVDRQGNVYYANYGNLTGEPSGLYMWTSTQIDSVRADLGHGDAGGDAGDLFLTYADGCFLTALPGGANGLTVDDAGNVFVTVNGSVSGLLMWNSSLGTWTEGDPDHYTLIATPDGWGWAGFLDAEGDVLNGGTLYAGSTMMGDDISVITYTGAIPEPATWVLIFLAAAFWLSSKPVTISRTIMICSSRFFLAIIALTGAISVVPVNAQDVEPTQPPNPSTGPYANGIGSTGIPNLFDEPVPGFVGPDGIGKARLAAGLDNDGNPVFTNPNNYVNPAFVGWATGVVEYKPAAGVAQNWQDPTKALGPVSGDNFDVVSLGELYLPYDVRIGNVNNPAPTKGQVPPYVNVGDPNRIPYSGNPADKTDGWSFVGYDQPGYITLSFKSPIVNGNGADLVVFENAFVSNYTIPGTGSVEGGLFAELAYVEVSTDGLHFARFPSVSLTDDLVNRYGSVDVSNIYNLAGKSANAYGESWGTPFDLSDLLSDPYALQLIADGYLDLDNIVYIKIIDIPGCGYYTDSLGNPIYDAWYTYGSGGFDLDAVGVLHNRESEYGEDPDGTLFTMSQLQTQAVPEPSTYLLLGMGAGMLFLLHRRRA